jgi:hypothetical protein
MSNWSDKPTAFVILWITLRDFHQLTTNYMDSENLKMSELTFYNSLASPAEREIAAKMLAVQLDNTFIKTYQCTYEPGKTPSQANNSLVTILSNKDKTLLDLGTECDALYKFLTE